MSKRRRGTTRDANRRRERHARAEFGVVAIPWSAHVRDRVLRNKKRRKWVEQRKLWNLQRREPLVIVDMPGPQP